MSAGLISLGGYLPAKKVKKDKQKELVDFLSNETLLYPEYIEEIRKYGHLPGKIETNYEGWESQPWYQAWLEKLPPKKRKNPFQGAKERRRVPLDPVSVRESIIPHPMLASDAETIAGAIAIINAKINKNDIDLVLSHSQVPDLALPENCSLIQHKLQLKNAGACGVDSCCSTFVSMIEMATGLVKSGIKKNVLIISSYLDSHVTDKSDYFSINTGDASVAGIVSNVAEGYGYISSDSLSHGDRHKGIIYQRRSPRLFIKTALGPSYEQEFTTFYDLDACKKIAAKAQEDMVFVVEGALKKATKTVSDIDFFVTHQPVSWTANAWREAVGIPKEKFYESFEKYGNIATCSAGVNLLEACENGLIKADDMVLIASSGAGENHIAILQKISPVLVKNTRL